MKKKVFLLLIVLSSFGFTGCSDEFGVKSMSGDVIFYLPEDIANSDISFQCDNDDFWREKKLSIINKDLLVDYYGECVNHDFFKQTDNNEYCYFNVEIIGMTSRRNHKIKISMEIDDIQYLGTIVIDYFNEDRNLILFNLISSEGNNIEGVFIYDFWRSI